MTDAERIAGLVTLCRELYEYALEVRTPDCAIAEPHTWLAGLRKRMNDLTTPAPERDAQSVTDDSAAAPACAGAAGV